MLMQGEANLSVMSFPSPFKVIILSLAQNAQVKQLALPLGYA